jgi:signal transduction histidine kinase
VERSVPDARAEAATLFEARRSDIITRYRSRLHEMGSTLAADDAYLAQACAQADQVITDVAASVGSGEARLSDVGMELVWQIGTTRASTHVHPAESLQAASELFDLVVDALTGVGDAAGAGPEIMATGVRAAHRSIMTRIRWASGAYVSQLLERVHEALLGERRRISRELHDRVGGRASIVLRNLELAHAYLDRDPSRARLQLDLARDGAVQTIEAIRQVATELRLEAEVDNLEKALRAFIDAMADAGTTVRLTISGDEGWVPAVTLDEVYQVVREALRNSLSHAAASTIRTSIDIAPHEIRVAVNDDGVGFDVRSPGRTGEGITSMRDRVEVLGGRLSLVSAPGAGTRVDVMIPLRGDEPA